MSSRYDQLTLQDAEKLLSTVRLTPGDREALDFYNDDHWRGGLGWIGQKPPPGAEYARQMATIEASYVAQNVTREVTERHVAGVLGREPRWSFVPRRPLAQGEEPNAEEQALIDEAEAALTEWWDARRPLPLLKEALTRAVLIRRSPLRLFLSDATPRDPSGVIPRQADLAAALALLHLDAPAPESAAVLTDPATQARVGIFAYERRDAAQPFAGLLGDGGQGTKAAALTYLDDDSATVVREVAHEGATAQPPSQPLPLGGRIVQRDLVRPALVTAQFRQMQKGLNLDLTQMLRNVNLAGSLERIFIDVMPPGRKVDSAGNPWVDGKSTGEATFIPEALPTGAAVSAFLESVTEEIDGQLVRRNGTLNYRNPVDVKTFIDTLLALYGAMLQEVAQAHARIAGDATATGESRKQARAEFEMSLETSKAAVDELGRWVMETLLALAAVFMGQPGRYDALRCEFGAVVDAGPLSSEDRQTYLAEWEAGAMSLESFLSLVGWDDVAAELSRIDAEREARAERARQAAAEAAKLQPQPTPAPVGAGGNGAGSGTGGGEGA